MDSAFVYDVEGHAAYTDGNLLFRLWHYRLAHTRIGRAALNQYKLVHIVVYVVISLFEVWAGAILMYSFEV